MAAKAAAEWRVTTWPMRVYVCVNMCVRVGLCA